MNSRLVIFNIVYYLTTTTLFYRGHVDPSSSLGYGFFIFGFWIVSAAILVLMVVRKKVPTKGVWNNIGLFLATPVIFFVAIGIGISMTDKVESEWHFDKNGYRYKVVSFAYRPSGRTMRREIYRSQEMVSEGNFDFRSITWIRDSTWTYYSETGETTKIEKYQDDRKLE